MSGRGGGKSLITLPAQAFRQQPDVLFDRRGEDNEIVARELGHSLRGAVDGAAPCCMCEHRQPIDSSASRQAGWLIGSGEHDEVDRCRIQPTESGAERQSTERVPHHRIGFAATR